MRRHQLTRPTALRLALAAPRIRCVAGLTLVLVLCPGVAATASTTPVFYDAAGDVAADPQPFLWLVTDPSSRPTTSPWVSG